jgi:superfamily I DNA/RNA helicase/mRNA-degrading endonuclease YafQ of YafQ-DinJ toxin-antitoxin module
MNFRIADTFTDALVKLENHEQKATKTTVFDLQMDSSGTGKGLRMHKLNGRDKNFWSVSVNKDIRIIIHRSGNSTLLCYVDHHDDAYAWAQDRKLEIHPTTGAAQLVEVAEISREVVIPIYIQKKVERETAKAPSAKPHHPLADKSESWLMDYGIPAEWIPKLKKATEDELLVLVDHLPAEAAEAVIDIAAGNNPPLPVKVTAAEADPFEHPDALRRFRTIDTHDELAAALDSPWDKWRTFLHPSQRDIVKKDYNGPARVSGSAGTGKTIVAIHRAAHLARTQEQSRVLLATFSPALAIFLRRQLHRLIQHEPLLGDRIDVRSLNVLAQQLYRFRGDKRALATDHGVREYLLTAAETVDHSFSTNFLFSEWNNVVNPWQLRSWEEYRDVRRIGRKTRLPEAKRKLAWDIFSQVFEQLEEQNQITQDGIFEHLAAHFKEEENRAPYEYVIIDEAQDLSVAQLRFLAALVGDQLNGLFFAGDLGQRIFQAPFSWSQLGVDVRGRASTLRINYRTSHQIRQQADLLLSTEVADVDGNTERRDDAQSVFNGAFPIIRHFETEEQEWNAVAEWIKDRVGEGIPPEAIAIFVRSAAQLDRGYNAIEQADQSVCQLDDNLSTHQGSVTLSTMHLAKGLEFRAVAVMAVDDEVIPDPDRIESTRDRVELLEVTNTERQLLYVACTRARDYLLVTSAVDASEFIQDLHQ